MAPGTGGGVTGAGAVTGDTEAAPALAGALGKCGSDGSENSGAIAGAEAGSDDTEV